MAPHSSTLASKIPWTDEPGRLQSMPTRAARDRPAPGALPARCPLPPGAPGEPRPHARFQERLSEYMERTVGDTSDLLVVAAIN